ncbi:hypothetical protein BYT27DRAFT_6794910 [Phlegmacium glaucopus]|nr:hypothetical protein BYT27DRAFT_6794910 [Phlegmacium glaucopus]
MSVNTLHKEALSAASPTDNDKPVIDIFSIHEQRAGRLVLDPAEAREEFGDELASKLKDGLLVLWPSCGPNLLPVYIRHEGKVVSAKKTGLRNRIKSLIGITGFQSARKDPTWTEVLIAPLNVVWRPHLFSILVLEAAVFGFGIGINVTITIFLQRPPPFGFGLGPIIVSGIYATPVVAVIKGGNLWDGT